MSESAIYKRCLYKLWWTECKFFAIIRESPCRDSWCRWGRRASLGLGRFEGFEGIFEDVDRKVCVSRLHVQRWCFPCSASPIRKQCCRGITFPLSSRCWRVNCHLQYARSLGQVFELIIWDSSKVSATFWHRMKYRRRESFLLLGQLLQLHPI